MTDLSQISDDDLLASLPRGARNNNPLNITGQGWGGQTGADGKFAQFATAEDGRAAADANLQAYYHKHGLNSVAGVVSRWAPPNENDTQAYIQHVSQKLGVGPNDPLGLDDPTARGRLLDVMSEHETPGSAAPTDLKSVSDADLLASVQGQGAPAAPVASQAPLPRQLVIDAETGKPYNDAQQATYGRLLDARQLDPSAKPGSKAFPRGMVAGGAPAPGDWYVDLDGSVKQVAPLTAAQTAGDVGQSFASGADKAVSGFLDDVVRSTNPIPRALDMAGKATAVGSWLAGGIIPKLPQLPTFSDSANKAAHQPQTTAGRIAEAGGEMLPNVLIAPGGAVRKAASVVLPALGMVGGEGAAKAMGGGEVAQQVGRAVGALGGGFASGLTPQLPQRVPKVSPEQLRQQADALYTELRNRSVQFTPRAVQSLAQGLDDIVQSEGRNLYPTHNSWVGQVVETLRQNPTVEALDKVRSKLQLALTTPTGSTTPDQLRVGKALVDEIDDFMAATARHPQVMTTASPQDAARVQQVLGQARDLWRRMRNVQTVQNLVESASNQNDTAHLGGNLQNMTARKLRTYIDPSTNKSLAGLSPEENAQLRRAVLGTPTSKTLKAFGALSPTKGLGAALNLIAGGLTAGKAPLFLAPIGYAANKAGGAVQAAELDRLIRMLASGQTGRRAGLRLGSPEEVLRSLAGPALALSHADRREPVSK